MKHATPCSLNRESTADGRTLEGGKPGSTRDAVHEEDASLEGAGDLSRACPSADPTLAQATVTLTMAEVMPHLEKVLAALADLGGYDASTADLSTDEKRRAAVMFALEYAGKCAADDDFDPDFDPDGDWGEPEPMPDLDDPDMHVRTVRLGGRGRPKRRPRSFHTVQ